MYELGLDWLRDDARLVGPVEQVLHRPAAGGAVVPRPLVDVHAHKLVGADGVVLEAAGVAGGVAQGLLTVVEGVADALGQQPAEPLLELAGKIALDAVATQG